MTRNEQLIRALFRPRISPFFAWIQKRLCRGQWNPVALCGRRQRPAAGFAAGWPETWWKFHKIMPELAKHYHVIALDLRGMGGSLRGLLTELF